MQSADPVAEVEAILKAVDSDRSGCIEYTGKFLFEIDHDKNLEFVMATLDRHNMLSKDRLDVVFKLIDKVKIKFE